MGRRDQEADRTVEALKAGTGGGIEVVDKGGGSWVLMLPANVKFEKAWREPDGRLVIPYDVPGKWCGEIWQT